MKNNVDYEELVKSLEKAINTMTYSTLKNSDSHPLPELREVLAKAKASQGNDIHNAAITFRNPGVFDQFFEATKLLDTPENRQVLDGAFKTVARAALTGDMT